MNRVNLQSGDNDITENFYKLTFPYVKNDTTLLNLGSGIRFNFEKNLTKLKKVKIDCCDIIPVKKPPSFINQFFNQSVEKIFFLKNKYDTVTFFELIEHIDKTDILLRNCFNNLKKDGQLIFSFPNLSSIYAQIELMLGFQPHILEVSNECADFGTGIFGKINNPSGKTIHHIRGITHRAMKEMVKYHGFTIIKKFGFEYRLQTFFKYIPSIAPVNIFICKKR